MASLEPADFQGGWICTEYDDLVTALGMLDEEYRVTFSQPPDDTNSYAFGRIGVLNVVLAPLASGCSDDAATTVVGADMRRTFTQLKLILLVGPAGAITNGKVDLRLGDAVIAVQSDASSGIVQYSTTGGIEQIGTCKPPPQFLLECVHDFQLQHQQNPGQVLQWTSEMLDKYPLF